MSHVVQVNGKLWSVHASSVTEPFAFISEVGDSYRVDDVEAGSLGSRRTLEAAVDLVEEYAARSNVEQVAHNARVEAAIGVLDGAA